MINNVNIDQKLEILKETQKTDFEALSCRLWILTRPSLAKGKAKYKCQSVAIQGLDDDFRSILKDFFCGGVREPINNLNQYKPLSLALDEDQALVSSIQETDLKNIIKSIHEGSDTHPVSDIEKILNPWAVIVEFYQETEYVIECDQKPKHIFAFTKIKGGWNIKKTRSLANWIFNEGKFKKVEPGAVFTFRNVFDFVAIGEDVFIRDKDNYELGLNIREGLKLKCDQLVREFEKFGIVASVHDLRVSIGSNRRLLGRFFEAVEKKFFEDQEFLEKMHGIVEIHGDTWPEQLKKDSNGKYIIDTGNIGLFLTLLADQRVKSLIREEIADASIIEPIAKVLTKKVKEKVQV